MAETNKGRQRKVNRRKGVLTNRPGLETNKVILFIGYFIEVSIIALVLLNVLSVVGDDTDEKGTATDRDQELLVKLY